MWNIRAIDESGVDAATMAAMSDRCGRSGNVAGAGRPSSLTAIEICAGAGGQALGVEHAGLTHLALVEMDADACATLRLNRPQWNTLQMDVRQFVKLAEDTAAWREPDLLAGGVPCPPFSKAGLQLGRDDERDLFPVALELAGVCRPRAVMLENVRGFLDPQFTSYREEIALRLVNMGYQAPRWELLHASDFGVPQLRPRVVMVAFRKDVVGEFTFPKGSPQNTPTVGETLKSQMGVRGWPGVDQWVRRASRVAPTLVGGSKKHGGPDLGPTRAKRQWWEDLWVDGYLVAEEAPGPDFPIDGRPRLTTEMAAVIQGFPKEWRFYGKKTSRYRQVGNAFPPPVAAAVARQIRGTLVQSDRLTSKTGAAASQLHRAPEFHVRQRLDLFEGVAV